MSLAKVVLNDIGTLANGASARQALNDNFQKIEDEFKKVVYRDGSTPNSMEADLDMDSHRILNVADAVHDKDAVNKGQVEEIAYEAAEVVWQPRFDDFVNHVEDELSRTLKLPPGYTNMSLPAPEPSRLIGWNAAGTALRNTDLSGPGDLTLRSDLADPTGGAALVQYDDDETVKDRLEAVQQDLDALASDDGASLIGYQSDATDSIPSTVRSKLRRLELDAYADFGVQADGITDDSDAFEKAIAAAGALGRRLILPEGTAANPRIIRITRPLVIPSGMTAINWLGGGSDKTIIRLDAATLATDALPILGAPKFIRIAGICFDQNNATTATTVGMMGIQNGEDIEIEFCEFLNFDKMGLAFNGCRGWRVVHNKFRRSSAGGPATEYNQAFLLSDSAQAAYDGEFAFNRCVGSGTNFAGSNLDIHHNDISGWGFGAGVTTEQTANTHSNSIRANKCHDSLNVVDVNGYRPAGIENWGHSSEISYNVLYGNAGAGIDQGGRRCRVVGNICYNNGKNTPSAGISNRYGDATYNASGSYYDGNFCFDSQVVKTQTKGFEDQSSSLSEISFGPGNRWNTVGTTPEVILSNAPSYHGPAVESAPVSWNPPSIAVGESASVAITVPGASMGDYVVVSFDQNLQGLTLTGYVSAPNTVTAVLANNTGEARDVEAGNIRARAIKPKNFSPY